MYISEFAVQQWAVGCTEVLRQCLGFSMKINKFNQQQTNICASCYIHFKIRKKRSLPYKVWHHVNISIILFSHPFNETSNLTKNILQKSICLEIVVENSLLSLEACLNYELYFQLKLIYFKICIYLDLFSSTCICYNFIPSLEIPPLSSLSSQRYWPTIIRASPKLLMIKLW